MRQDRAGNYDQRHKASAEYGRDPFRHGPFPFGGFIQFQRHSIHLCTRYSQTFPIQPQCIGDLLLCNAKTWSRFSPEGEPRRILVHRRLLQRNAGRCVLNPSLKFVDETSIIAPLLRRCGRPWPLSWPGLSRPTRLFPCPSESFPQGGRRGRSPGLARRRRPCDPT